MAQPSGKNAASAAPPIAARQPRRRLRIVGWVLVGIFAFFLALFEVVLPIVASHRLLDAGTAAPLIQLSDAKGHTHDVLAEAAGKPVVVDFFNTTCPDCIAEVPAVCQAVKDHPEVFIVEVETGDHSAADIADFAKTSGNGCLTIPLLVDPGSRISADYHILDTPTAYLITQGRIRAAGIGTDKFAGVVSAAG